VETLNYFSFNVLIIDKLKIQLCFYYLYKLNLKNFNEINDKIEFYKISEI
jgi:hypothetical protein